MLQHDDAGVVAQWATALAPLAKQLAPPTQQPALQLGGGDALADETDADAPAEPAEPAEGAEAAAPVPQVAGTDHGDDEFKEIMEEYLGNLARQDNLDTTVAGSAARYEGLKTQLIELCGEQEFAERYDEVVQRLADFEAKLRPADAVDAADARSELRAWMTKKAEKRGRDRRRFFELYNSEIAYFAKERGGRGVVAKGTIAITPRTIVESNGPVLFIKTVDRIWELLTGALRHPAKKKREREREREEVEEMRK